MEGQHLPPFAKTASAGENRPTLAEWSRLLSLSKQHSIWQQRLDQSAELLAFSIQQCKNIDSVAGSLRAENARLLSELFPLCSARGHDLEKLQSNNAQAPRVESQLLETVEGHLRSLQQQPQLGISHSLVSMLMGSPPLPQDPASSPSWQPRLHAGGPPQPPLHAARPLPQPRDHALKELHSNGSNASSKEQQPNFVSVPMVSPAVRLRSSGEDESASDNTGEAAPSWADSIEADVSAGPGPSSSSSNLESTAAATVAVSASAVQPLVTSAVPPQGVTTLVVRNVPLRYTQEMLLAQWPPNGSFDYLHVPYHKPKQCHTAFINFTSYEAMSAFFLRWHGRTLPGRQMGSPLNILVADVQGRTKNVHHLRHRNVANINDVRFHPAVFDGTTRVDFRMFLETIMNASPLVPGEVKQGVMWQ